MKILLVSPLDPNQPTNLKLLMGGENTYTRTLLKFPPKGIKWIRLEDAINRGAVTESVLQVFFLWLQKFRILPPGPRLQMIHLNEEFDLVYAHGYPVKLSGKLAPLVISDSSSAIIFLEKYLKWPTWRIKINQKIKKILFKLFNVVDAEVNIGKAKVVFVFSRWAKRIKNLEFRIRNCEVVYPGLPTPSLNKNKVSSRLSKDNKNIKLLFVGVWFERKGGRLVLSVFRKLARKFNNIHLTILGQLPKNVLVSKNEPIIQKDFVSYKELLKHYQTHDILVHVPPEIEGYGITVTEAMSYGMIPVVSNICALPEFVEHGKSGLIVKGGSITALEVALTKLISDKRLRQKLSWGAHTRFFTKFSLPVFHKKINQIFSKAIS